MEIGLVCVAFYCFVVELGSFHMVKLYLSCMCGVLSSGMHLHLRFF